MKAQGHKVSNNSSRDRNPSPLLAKKVIKRGKQTEVWEIDERRFFAQLATYDGAEDAFKKLIDEGCVRQPLLDFLYTYLCVDRQTKLTWRSLYKEKGANVLKIASRCDSSAEDIDKTYEDIKDFWNHDRRVLFARTDEETVAIDFVYMATLLRQYNNVLVRVGKRMLKCTDSMISDDLALAAVYVRTSTNAFHLRELATVVSAAYHAFGITYIADPATLKKSLERFRKNNPEHYTRIEKAITASVGALRKGCSKRIVCFLRCARISRRQGDKTAHKQIFTDVPR